MKKVFAVFCIIGSLLLVGAGFAAANSYSFKNSAIKVAGTVFELERQRSDDSFVYYPLVRFITSQGELVEFRSDVGSNPSAYHRGETVQLLYPADKPEHARINSFLSLWGLSAFLGAFGLIFMLIGSACLLVSRSKARKAAMIKENGNRVEAQIIAVERNNALQVNGRSPFQIVCQWHDRVENKVYEFHSENIWFDPEPFIQNETIAVFLDRNNHKKYVVDIAFLPKKA